MNDEGRRHSAPQPITILCSNCTAGLGEYGGEQAQQCPQCGHVSPSRLHLDRHLLRQCCGLLGRAA